MTSYDPRVAAAFDAVPRRDYLPAEVADQAGEDVPLSLGHRSTNSQPSTVAAMLELLGVATGDRVLDVGAGSGWTTALLAHLTGPEGRVTGVELVPELVEQAAARLEGSGMPWATVHPALPGVLGWPDSGPYDRILVSAMATSVPSELTDQLADRGRMVLPVRGRMIVVERHGDEVKQWTAEGHYRFVPLR